MVFRVAVMALRRPFVEGAAEEVPMDPAVADSTEAEALAFSHRREVADAEALHPTAAVAAAMRGHTLLAAHNAVGTAALVPAAVPARDSRRPSDRTPRASTLAVVAVVVVVGSINRGSVPLLPPRLVTRSRLVSLRWTSG
jgi:hypothetical protein